MSKLEVDAVEPQSGTSLTLGASGDTITIPSGAIISNQGTATGFGPTGAVSWDVANIKTSGFTAVNGLGYFCNTTSAAFTVTLPASPAAGNVVAISDYAATFATNNITVNPNGNKIAGSTQNKLLNTNGIAVTLVYVDSTEGWLVTDSGLQSNFQPLPYSIDFLVVGGGGSGGTYNPSPGYAPGNPGSNSSISGSGLTTITSTGGGYGGNYLGNVGGNGGSGGGGGSNNLGTAVAGGTGNTPSTSPSQGNNGGSGLNSGPSYFGGGGGGAGAVGGNANTSPGAAGDGGAGTASSITGSSVTRAGGGGGCKYSSAAGNNGTGGSGGGGDGGNPSGVAGTANTGSGGGAGDAGGAGHGGGGAGGYRTSTQSVSIGTVITVSVGNGGAAVGGSGAGGKGVVILSLPIANYSNTTTGSPTVTDSGSNKILVFNGDGSYTA